MLFTTMYGCGLRVSEGVALEVTDIDSQRRVIHGRPRAGVHRVRTPKTGSRWINCPRGFLMPVKLLSRKFRGKFLALLKQSHQRGELTLKGSLAPYRCQAAFKAWLSPLYGKEWVVYAKPPWNGPQNVLKYLARYTHRVANRRALTSMKVTSLWTRNQIQHSIDALTARGARCG